jgi:pyruvate dehydrogenase E2 component (dihydrolipoamide acetyltransferase)
MPALEMAQDTGKLVSWRKREGEKVEKGEVLLEIETDKAVVEIEAAADGVLAGVKAAPGDLIPVGQTIAWILGNGESVPAEEMPPRSGAASSQSSSLVSPKQGQSPAPDRTSRLKISPKARRIAQERGIDVASLIGSGPEGEILVSDILSAKSTQPSKAAAPADVPEVSATGDPGSGPVLSSIARLMAERATQSWTTIPHFFVTREVDATRFVENREKQALLITRSHAVRVTHSDLLISIVARALEQHPRLNASFVGGAIQFHDEINIGLAMAVEDGVVTGAIRHANKIALAEVALQRRDLAERARAGRLRPNDINGATFTISNLGMYQVSAFTAIIVPPQAAILAVGEIADRVLAVDGKPTVRPTISLTLSCDHRVVDGARAAEFMQTLADAILSGASRDSQQAR